MSSSNQAGQRQLATMGRRREDGHSARAATTATSGSAATTTTAATAAATSAGSASRAAAPTAPARLLDGERVRKRGVYDRGWSEEEEGESNSGGTDGYDDDNECEADVGGKGEQAEEDEETPTTNTAYTIPAALDDHISEAGYARVEAMIQAAQFEDAIPLPKTPEEVPAFNPLVISPFVIPETLEEMEQPAFATRKVADGELGLLYIRGNYLIYTADAHPIAASFFNPYAVVDQVDPWQQHPKMTNIGLKLEELVEHAKVEPHHSTDARVRGKKGKQQPSRKKKDPQQSYVQHVKRRRGIKGTRHLSHWTPTAFDQPCRLVSSPDCSPSGTALTFVKKIGENLAPFLEMSAKLTRSVDPHEFERLLEAYRLKVGGSAFDRTINNRFMLFSGLAVVHNVAVKPHIDPRDPKCSWGLMAPFGKYLGGQLLFEQLGVRSEYRPGTFVLLRARLIRHSVSEFTGSRHSAVLFWREWLLRYNAEEADFEGINAGEPARWGLSKEEMEAIETLCEEKKERLKKIRREMDAFERIFRR